MSAREAKMNVPSVEALLEKIKEHNAAYRAGKPIISDFEYDAEVEMLRGLAPDHEWFKHIEPVNVSASRKVSLPIPMKSLNKVKSVAELLAWYKQFAINEDELVVITPKFDGLSLLFNEDTGQAYSRGGVENEGQDCTEHAKAAGIQRNNRLFYYTYGEFVFNCNKWEENFVGKHSETGDPYKSPRNTAAGLLMRDVPSPLLKHVDFVRYGTDEHSLSNFKTYLELYTSLCDTFQQNRLCLAVQPSLITEEYLLNIYKEWRKQYYIDGLVIYVNDLALWEKIGRHSTTGNPLYAIAYKHPDFTEAFETTVKGINWKVSKSGALKPVVNIDAVDTGDCQMENPTGYNASVVSNMQLAKGAKILVTRSGGVIPKILQTLVPANQIEIEKMWDELAACPDCGQPTAWNQSYKELMCTNPNCPGIQLAKIVFFFTICEVEEMGEETFAKLYDAGFTTIKSILDITAKEIMDIEGFGEGTASVILKNMRTINSCGVDLPTLMQASDCFAGIGKAKAQKILDELSDIQIDTLCDPFAVMTDEAVKTAIDQADKEIWKSFWRGYNKFKDFMRINALWAVRPQKVEINENGKYSGMSICFSGVRDAALEKRIIAGGGKIASGVSKNTTHLIVKDSQGGSSKISKATQLGIPIIEIENFDKFFN